MNAYCITFVCIACVYDHLVFAECKRDGGSFRVLFHISRRTLSRLLFQYVSVRLLAHIPFGPFGPFNLVS